MFGPFVIISIFLWNFTFASLPLPHDDHLHSLPPEEAGYPGLPVHDTEYLSPPHHLDHPPPPPPQHAAPIIEVKPLVERVPVDPAHCALIVPDHRPPVASLAPGLPYVNSNYIVGRSKRSIPYGPYASPAAPVTPHDGPGNLCITYEDVNKAILQAKAKSGGFIPQEIYELSSDFPKPAHVGVPAAILEEATRILAARFGLSRQTILYLLPRVDTTRTVARDICPTFLLPVKCELSKYRTLTGMCNNLNYPSWGATRTAMIRMLPPDYADGIAAPRRAYDGSPLPSPRRVSFILHQDITQPDAHVSYLLVAFGQTLDHDLTFGPITRDPFGNEIECCGKPAHDRHPACLPLELPKDDPFFKFFKRTCMEFARIIPSLKPNCPLGPRGQANQISAYIDGNFIYGSNQEKANSLREKKGGRMKVTSLWRHLGLKDLLPMNTAEPDKGCERKGHPRNAFCFDAGDERVNEQLPLTVTHTILLREHNRIADYLTSAYPYWDDEKIYQESRRIVVAQIQHITFNEWLPVILGRKIMNAYGLDLLTDGYYNGYDEKTNPTIRVAFQAAAFRFGHSILPDVIERYNKYHQKLEAIRLSVLLRQPFDMYKPGSVDTYILGLLNQEAARMDADVTTEVTNHLFERPGSHFGRDLAAINIQRGRELGVPGYNAFREYCGLNRVKDWYELAGSFDNRTLHRMQILYKHVDDIDLFSAGIAEYPLPGALLGPVFSCIIAEQFANIRKGDRFWYENYGQFTPEQLAELRKVKMARIVCDNSDDIETIQLFPFLTADPHTNPRVSCHDIPSIDLSRFVTEHPPPHSHPAPGYISDNHLKSASGAASGAASSAAASSAKAAASS